MIESPVVDTGHEPPAAVRTPLRMKMQIKPCHVGAEHVSAQRRPAAGPLPKRRRSP